MVGGTSWMGRIVDDGPPTLVVLFIIGASAMFTGAIDDDCDCGGSIVDEYGIGPTLNPGGGGTTIVGCDNDDDGIMDTGASNVFFFLLRLRFGGCVPVVGTADIDTTAGAVATETVFFFDLLPPDNGFPISSSTFVPPLL